jgi:hypothetical protein
MGWNYLKTAFFYMLFMLLWPPQHAFASSGTKGAAFLDIPVGAGPAALGSAYTALATDAYAPIYNPAGLGFLSGTQVAAQHLSYLDSINDEFMSFVHPVGEGKAIGFSAQYLGTGNVNATGPDNAEPLGTYSSHYGAYSMVYGQKVTDKLSWGLTGKWINAKLANVSANAYAADIWSLYQATDHLKLAVTATNLGSKLTFTSQGDPLPQEEHLAAAYQPERYWTLVFEGVHSQSGLNSGRAGVEWSPIERVKLRAGYKTDTTQGLSAMAGLTTGIGLNVWGQEFSYAWVPYGDLGDTQYFSMLIRFGRSDETQNLLKREALKWQNPKDWSQDKANDPEYQQLIQLMRDEPERNALAPETGTDK